MRCSTRRGKCWVCCGTAAVAVCTEQTTQQSLAHLGSPEWVRLQRRVRRAQAHQRVHQAPQAKHVALVGHTAKGYARQPASSTHAGLVSVWMCA